MATPGLSIMRAASTSLIQRGTLAIAIDAGDHGVPNCRLLAFQGVVPTSFGAAHFKGIVRRLGW
jgi:hypothetical protein